MCKTCFDKEYLNFPTQKDFEDFNVELTKKLNLSELKYIGDDGKYLQYGYSIYRCDNCRTTWWLNDPENAWRGFFVHEDTAKKIINDLEKENRRGQADCYIILAIIVLITTLLIFKYCGH